VADYLQNINILTLGNPEGKGVFFPEGLLGEITTPTGYNKSDPGNETFPSGLTMNSAILDTQVYYHDIDICMLSNNHTRILSIQSTCRGQGL